ncbi:hypothetical protein Btru_064860 [Bulinus truncatus]|nr:hypothetical protein Btru_064860 [Bulinus truncatus]
MENKLTDLTQRTEEDSIKMSTLKYICFIIMAVTGSVAETPIAPQLAPILAQNLTNADLMQIKRMLEQMNKNEHKKTLFSIDRREGGGYMCQGVTEFMYDSRRAVSTQTIPYFNASEVNVTVVIDNRSSCNNVSHVRVSGVMVLNVSVETCCITHCLHTIEVAVGEAEHILLNFTSFNLPGMTLTSRETEELCEESLSVEANVPDRKSPGQMVTYRLGQFCGIKSPKALFVDFNKITLKLQLKDNRQCVDKMSFEVKIIPCMVMEYEKCNSSNYTSFHEDHGYILSPGKNEGRNYPNDIECEWSINVPEGKLIELRLDLILHPLGEGDVIEVHAVNRHGWMFPAKLSTSHFHFRWPVVLPSNQCKLKFISDGIKSGRGFNISYVAVNYSKFIPMYPNNSLDCSKHAKPQLHKNIACNMQVDCISGEDEVDCQYQDPRCWPGAYFFRNSCYEVVLNQKQVSWTMAEEYCERNLSSHLVAINTAIEAEFIEKLRRTIGKDLKVMFLGLRRMRMQQVSQLYRRMWQWTDGTTAFYLPKEYRREGWSRCSLFHSDYFHSTECGAKKETMSFICEWSLEPPVTVKSNVSMKHKFQDIGLGDSPYTFNVPTFLCLNSKEHIFEEQRCDKVDNCFDHSDESDCNYEPNESTMFACGTSGLLPYSFVCDGIEGCQDGSDEKMCRTPAKNVLGPELYACKNGMILDRADVCNGKEDCLDGTDEKDCTECSQGSYLCPMIACLPQHWITDGEIDCPIRDLKGREVGEIFKENVFESILPPGIIHPDGYGKYTIQKQYARDPCPDTHQECRDGYCLPVYMWCNGVPDCPFGEDEVWEVCKQVCVLMYKCKYSRVCVHNVHICDDIYHCPYHDDELLCHFRNVTCPDHCECKRMELTCSVAPEFNTSTPVPVRYLRLNNAYLPDLQFKNIASYTLIYLNVSHSNVRTIHDENLKYLNLRILDASHNDIEFLGNDTFKHCPVLKTLILTNNKFNNAYFGFLQHTKELSKLDLSYNIKNELEDYCFQGASALQELILRYMNIEKINKNAFANLLALKRIDLKGNHLLDVSDPIFAAQINLREIITDNYRLCCDLVKPQTVAYTDCKAPYDEISSCADILRTLLLRAALWIMAILTLFGNLGVIIYRIFVDRGMKQSFRILITCLSASDLLMGIYLVIIGSADANYRDNYQLYEKQWTSSALCQAAGFLCLLSSETSALFILLITLDRLLAIAFPMSTRCHFNGKSAAIACGIIWFVGLCMAAIPLLPPFQHWQLYTQNALGVPLPITRSFFPGYDYAFAILIVFNMIVFILVAVGQLLIYLSVRLKKHPKVSKVRVRQDTAIAKRLILVVLTDCLCWFPITVMGLAARSGLPVPGEMNVVATVFLLPANSAFNPFLYTANAILMARKMRKQKNGVTWHTRRTPGGHSDNNGLSSSKNLPQERDVVKLTAPANLITPSETEVASRVLPKKSTALAAYPKKKNSLNLPSAVRAPVSNRTPRMITKSHGVLNFEDPDEYKGRSQQPLQNASVKSLSNGRYECLGMTRFMYEARKSFPSETIPPFNATRVNSSVVIENKSSCNSTSYLNVSQVTLLNVTVETCCITNCVHVIEVSVSQREHILLNFLHFNVPGLNLLRSEAFGKCDESLDVYVEIADKNDPKKKTTFPLGNFCGIKAPTAVFVEYNKVKMSLRLLDNKQCVDKMDFLVEIVPCMKFEYKQCHSPDYVGFYKDHGYISSPGMNMGLNYPNELECKWDIAVPEGKLLLLKAERILLKEGDKIEIYPEKPRGSQFPSRLNFSDFEFRRPVVLPSNKCTVKFHSDSLKSGIGFNISYIAVYKSSFIPMFQNNSLDCSNVTHLPEDVRCDYYKDCAGEEDEIDCPYLQEECPKGYVYNGHCYQLVSNQPNMSWTKAEEYCERNLGAHLVTINTVEESNFLQYFREYKELDENATFLGLRRMRMQQVKQVYRRMWQWTDGSTAFYLPKEYRYEGWARCSLLHSDYFHSTECGALKENISFICERTLGEDERIQIPDIIRERRVSWSNKISVFKCHSGEYISSEQECDKVEQCFDHSDETNCKLDDVGDSNEPTFACDTNGRLPYSFVCDGIADCPDGSDEARCKIPDKTALGFTIAICTDGMYLNRSRVCDGREDCRDSSDEEDCTECVSGSTLCPMIACLPQKWINDSEIDCPIRDLKGRQALESEFKENAFTTLPPPGIIYPDGYGKFEIKKISENDSCPDTHAQCYKGYCIPVYMWCNDDRDCPYGEDEDSTKCEKLCKGLYKCKHSSVCVHNDHLCDGVYHCPYHDDEMLCTFKNIVCPTNCRCKRYEFSCSSPPEIDPGTPVPVRSLQIHNFTNFHDLKFKGIAFYSLIYLNVSYCGVKHITDDNLRFSNLRILDASHNLIENLSNDTFKNCPVLKILVLSHNKFHNTDYGFLQNTKELSTLDLSFNIKNTLEEKSFHGATDLEELILQYMSIEVIHEDAFKNLVALKRIDLKGNTLLIFSDKIFSSQKNLRAITTDNYRLCCDAVKPATVQHTECDAPFDEISSCSDILRTLLLRAALWIMAILTLTGNFGVIIYRIFIDRGLKQSFRIIITCLSTSDLLMGIYLVLIGAADAEYRNRYQLNEMQWKNSVSCQAAGFLCLLSSETSALFILLVTLDRLLAIAFPLNPHLHFNAKSATVACGIVWMIGLCLASIPLLPPFQHWQLYTQKAVGVPLPITRSLFPGYDYAFAILIVFNMIVFILVAVGQLLIYLSVRLQNLPQVSEIRLRQDTVIAKRLVLVIITDCLCWFPITVMGLAARSGYPVPGEMYVVATVFLLPANSAFNPFLYTANAILLARRMRKKKQCIEIDIGLRQLSSS